MKNKTERTRKPLKKAALKSIIALVLCMATIIGSIGAGANTASAAKKTLILKVQFKGKTIDLFKDSLKIGDVKKKWGKPKKEDRWEYIWKKGKSSIKIGNVNGVSDSSYIGGITIDIRDKNFSVFGVKVGMKKATAMKKLKNTTNGTGLTVKSHTDTEYGAWLCVAQKHNTKKGSVCSYFDLLPLRFGLKSGKVSNIYFWCS